ncbi:diaminopimelate decarboxylase [Fulvimarina sp. 2208YS6-2-32]|uniref:Diaminopimelate decarboxylase n=1 Tax=Fulvimarina uroteuthidis TaxID=3098149 RepID=A0ABU5I1P6_9HYPH|nr:diaminopimelate decarboxylase [Fulvimarina sp. 2208YS6-2-32]MDY8108903.1 diaminopimelate decarboxylase [Fulvimarina sp. 2208YS6-2-32]
MNHFEFKDGELHAEDIAVAQIADEIGTPFYCYSTATLNRHYDVFCEAFSDIDAMVCYAMKANSNQAVLKTLADRGAGADVVSGGELLRALRVGIDPKKIMFSGVGKTISEIDMAIASQIFCFNIESENELALISARAVDAGMNAHVSFRINPDVDARTHAKISTGKKSDKFGIAYDRAEAIYRHAAGLPGIRISGIDMHIGSQIIDLEPFDQAFDRLASLVGRLRNAGHEISHVDLGGGLGVPYKNGDATPPEPHAYAEVVKRHVRGLGAKIVFEPGRMLVANAGIMVARVLYVKRAEGKTFVIVDAAMNDLIRPTLYEAWHEIQPVREPVAGGETMVADIVGPICESGDYLGKDRTMARVAEGDLVFVSSAGAYGAVQSSTYNTRPLIAETLVKGGEYAVIRERQTLDELIGLDHMPDWLEG